MNILVVGLGTIGTVLSANCSNAPFDEDQGDLAYVLLVDKDERKRFKQL